MVEDQARRWLVEAGILPETMPENVTFNKVREILKTLEGIDSEELSKAIGAAQGQKIRGPLASMIFIKHHLEGAHEVEVDRIDESEEGARLAILIYPEGELPIRIEYLPKDINTGIKLSYDPFEERYSQSTAPLL